MKKLFSVLFAMAIGAGMIFAQDTAPAKETQTTDGPVMKFEKTTVDYGEIAKGSDPYRYFDFTNVGNEPLIIKNAKGSCGCTVPEWPKEPILPGESAQIKVRYATDRVGKINKSIRLTTNEGGKQRVLRIIGNVKKSGNAPKPTTPKKKSLIQG